MTIKQMQDTLVVTWNHDYYMCRNFTISLNGTDVPECTNITALNCTVMGFQPGMSYNVTVSTTEFLQKSEDISKFITTMTLEQTPNQIPSMHATNFLHTNFNPAVYSHCSQFDMYVFSGFCSLDPGSCIGLGIGISILLALVLLALFMLCVIYRVKYSARGTLSCTDC